MATNVEPKPIPIVDDDSRPYWDAARNQHLSIPKCDSCGLYVFYPRVICPHCKSEAIVWRDVAGVGVVYSFTIVRFAISSAYAADVPYVVALIRLNEGVLIMANIVACQPDEVVIGMRVRVVFEKVSDEITLPQFCPSGES